MNHRFCDVRFSLPRDLDSLVPQLEPVVRQRVRRGRVDVSVVVGFSSDAVQTPSIDAGRARGYWQAYTELGALMDRPVDVPLAVLAQCPGVLRAPEAKLDLAEDVGILSGALEEAIDLLVTMRKDEGRQLSSMLERHLGEVASLRDRIVQLIPQAVGERQAKLHKRIDELLGDRVVDESRMAQEMALLAERADVTEEVERLASHIVQFRRLLADEDAVGRKMDFLIQEMNREANTVGSKCSHAAVAHLVVDLKAELERLREQVQNVE